LKTTLGPRPPRALGAELGTVDALGAKLPVVVGRLDAEGPRDGACVGWLEVLGASLGVPVG